jgi:hypothetical protein
MGFTLSRYADYSNVSALPTPEQEAIAAANHNHMKQLAANPPITIGTKPQITWAKSIADQFLFYAHAWGFKANDIDLLFANRGKYARFWIDNKCARSGEGTTRIAVEKELAEINRQFAPRSNDELRKLAKRF